MNENQTNQIVALMCGSSYNHKTPLEAREHTRHLPKLVPRQQAATTISPGNAAVANTTANIARSSFRVNVPCATPCSSSLPLPTYSRRRRVLCASRRENGRWRGELDGKPALHAVELAHAKGRTRCKKAGKSKKTEQR